MNFDRLFSIVVPVLNEEEHIGNLLRSIFAQRYRPIEVILVDDGSNDDTVEIVKKIQEIADEDFQIILLEEKDFGMRLRGPAFARNIGLRNLHGQYVLLVDADMVLTDINLVSELVETLKNNDVAGVRVKILIDTWIERNLMIDEGDSLFRAKGNWACLAFTEKILREFEFDSSMGVGEDLDFLKKLRAGRIFNPVVVNAIASLHLPHSLKEYRLQKSWQGRSGWLLLKKNMSVKSLLHFSPALSMFFLFSSIVCILLRFSLGYITLAAFFGIFLWLVILSPEKSFSRISYLFFVRLIYGSFWFIIGALHGLWQLFSGKGISPSRGT